MRFRRGFPKLQVPEQSHGRKSSSLSLPPKQTSLPAAGDGHETANPQQESSCPGQGEVTRGSLAPAIGDQLLGVHPWPKFSALWRLGTALPQETGVSGSEEPSLPKSRLQAIHNPKIKEINHIFKAWGGSIKLTQLRHTILRCMARMARYLGRCWVGGRGVMGTGCLTTVPAAASCATRRPWGHSREQGQTTHSPHLCPKPTPTM